MPPMTVTRQRQARHIVSAWATALSLSLLWSTSAQAQAAPETVTVQRGETFGQIAARFVGDVRKWRKVYDPQRSGLPDPNLILVGQQFELVTEAGGARYLRLVGGPPAAATAAAGSRPVVTPTPAPTPTAAPSQSPVTAAAAPAAVAAPAPADDTLVIGVLPNVAAAVLQGQYEHVKRYLERQNPYKVRIVVPGNFKAFFDGMVGGEYDIAVSAPNLARVAQLDRGLVPLGMYEPRIGALFVASAERSLASPREVAGLAVGFANPQSLVALYGQQWLRGMNLEPGRDYEIKAARSDLGIGRMLLTGDIAAAIMSNGEYRALPADESSRLKIVEVFARIPNFVWLAHPKLAPARVERLRSQLKGLFADKDEGAAFARATGLSGLVDADDAALRELDAFNGPTRRAMGLAR
jgi:phosphonate transport system substrate-binding protein